MTPWLSVYLLNRECFHIHDILITKVDTLRCHLCFKDFFNQPWCLNWINIQICLFYIVVNNPRFIHFILFLEFIFESMLLIVILYQRDTSNTLIILSKHIKPFKIVNSFRRLQYYMSKEIFYILPQLCAYLFENNENIWLKFLIKKQDFFINRKWPAYDKNLVCTWLSFSTFYQKTIYIKLYIILFCTRRYTKVSHNNTHKKKSLTCLMSPTCDIHSRFPEIK